MKILITGGNGMVARALREHCTSIGDTVYALARTDLDISSRDAALEMIVSIRPDAVVNCAAFTNVDGAESREAECFESNAIGVGNLAAACREADTAFITISTDYVFDGSYSGFYDQRKTPKPFGVYARSKREGEVMAFNEYPRTSIVRSGWIFGHGGTNFLSTMPALLASGESIRAIQDSFGTPTFAGDLAGRLRDLAVADLPGVYHVANSGEGCSYFGFAQKVCSISGYDLDMLQAMSHADLKRPAPRPINSKLACVVSEKLGFKPLRRWEAALEEFLTEKN